MATTKTLTPTNQAITLAAFTEKPDNRTNVTNDDKLADAVNALNSNMNVLGRAPTRTTCSTLDAIKSAISTAVESIPNNSIGYTILALTASILPFVGGDWIVQICKTYNNYFSGYATSYSTSRDAVYFQNMNGTWKFDQLALKSDITNLNDILSNIAWSGIAIDTSNSYFLKNNRTFNLQIISDGQVSITDNMLLGTIDNPSYTPYKTSCFSIFDYNSSKPINGSIWVQSNGKITYFGDAISSKKIRFGCTWLV